MKSRPSKLDTFAEQLTEWFSPPSKVSLAEAQSRLAALGCSVSQGRLSEWWEAQQRDLAIKQALAGVATGAQMGREIEAAFAKNPAPELQMLVGLLKNLVLQLTLRGTADPDSMGLAGELMKRVLDFAKLQSTEAMEQAKRELQARTEKRQREELTVKQRLATVAEYKIGELLLKAAKDVRAQEIAGMDCPNEEKIRLLRQHYFADVDELERSGAVKLPPVS